VKRTGLIFTSLIIFAISLYAAYLQGVNYVEINGAAGGHLAAPFLVVEALSPFWAAYLNAFAGLLKSLTDFFGGSLIASMVLVAFVVELLTLYPSVNLQLKQKKIHLFHKKLVDRFQRGELTMSEGKRELDVLYSVNERIHRRGAWLFISQVVIFVMVLRGLYLVAKMPTEVWGPFSPFNIALLNKPLGVSLPILAALAYLLHSLVKIHLKQREDYISMKQVYTALSFAIVAAAVVFYCATILPVLLTVYFLTQITFVTLRYVFVEERAAEWGKHVQRNLIHLLKTSRLHKNRLEHFSRKFNHLPFVRHINFHLLEEALSMSLAIVLVLNGMM